MDRTWYTKLRSQVQVDVVPKAQEFGAGRGRAPQALEMGDGLGRVPGGATEGVGLGEPNFWYRS
jgi:hypothetical protein